MLTTFETKTIAESMADEGIREEKSGVILQYRNTPETIERLSRRKAENTRHDRGRDHFRSEMMFLAHRNFNHDQVMKRIHALELQVVEDFPLDRILAAVDPTENQRLYEELCWIENSYINQLITLDNAPGAKFDDQRGLARINLVRFLLSKTELCYYNNKKLTKENLAEFMLDDNELRLNDIRKQIRHLFNEAQELLREKPIELKPLLDDMLDMAAGKERAPAIPNVAPEFYKDRSDRKEKPDEFIRRVYAPWLTRGLLRPHIKALDLPLYQSLYKQGIPDDFETLLPTAAGRSADDLARSDSELLESKRASTRRAQARRRHKDASIL